MISRVKTRIALSARRPATQPGDHAEADTENDLDEERHGGQSQGDGERVTEDVRDRTTAGYLSAEIKMQDDTCHVIPVLLQDRLVQPQLVPHGGQGGRVGALVPEESPHGVAGQGVDHQEDQQGCPDEDRDHLEQSSCDIAPHGASM